MSHALPLPRRTTFVAPLAALALGAAGGTTAALLIADDDTVVRTSSPVVEVRAIPKGATPVPERVAPAPPASVSGSTSTPVPERVSPAPPTSSLAGTTSSTPAPPDRISGAHTR